MRNKEENKTNKEKGEKEENEEKMETVWFVNSGYGLEEQSINFVSSVQLKNFILVSTGNVYILDFTLSVY